MPYFESCVSFFISCCCSISVRMVGRWCVKSNNNNNTFVNACRPHSKHSTDILQRVWVHVGIKFQGRIRALSDTIPGPTIPNEKNNRRETINFGAWTCNFFFQFDCPCYCSPVQYVMIRWYDTMIGVESSPFICYEKSYFYFIDGDELFLFSVFSSSSFSSSRSNSTITSVVSGCVPFLFLSIW